MASSEQLAIPGVPLPPERIEVTALTPMQMVAVAVSQNADLDKLSRLMDLQERWEANERRKAFVDAMTAFKSESISIIRDRDNKQYGSKYVSLGNLVNTVTPYLSRHGLSARWDIDQTSGIKVSCIITHKLGHSESVSMVCPPDKSGAKNPIQEIKSAITYAKACTFESICGLASTDANLDDDGNRSHMDDLQEQLEWIANAGSPDELRRIYTAAYNRAKSLNDQRAMKALIDAKDRRKKEFVA